MILLNHPLTGAAVGIIKNYDDITPILIAIVAHKFFSAFALGISLVKSGMPTGRTTQLVISFACSTPAGILLGWLTSHILVGALNSLTTEIVKGIAAGTFVYVALAEILLEEFSPHHHSHGHSNNKPSSMMMMDDEDGKALAKHDSSTERYNKFLFVLLGVVTMSLFAMYTAH
jgi:zinc transporter ZupT